MVTFKELLSKAAGALGLEGDTFTFSKILDNEKLIGAKQYLKGKSEFWQTKVFNDFLETEVAASDRSQDMIETLLEFSDLELGKLETTTDSFYTHFDTMLQKTEWVTGPTYEQYVASHDFRYLMGAFPSYNTWDGSSEIQLASINGHPIRFRAYTVVHNPGDQHNYWQELRLEITTQENLGTGTYVAFKLTYDTPDIEYIGSTSASGLDGLVINLDVDSTQWVTGDGIAQAYSNVAEDYATFSDMLTTCCVAGMTSATRLNQILDSHMNCEFVTQLREEISSKEQWSASDIRTKLAVLVSKLVPSSDSEVADDGFYTPKELPGYSTDVFALICIGVITVIVVILSMIFKAVAAIVTMVIEIVSKVFDFMSTKMDETTVQTSILPRDVPVLNFPLGLKQYVPKNRVLKSIVSAVGEYGCVAIQPSYCLRDTNPGTWSNVSTHIANPIVWTGNDGTDTYLSQAYFFMNTVMWDVGTSSSPIPRVTNTKDYTNQTEQFWIGANRTTANKNWLVSSEFTSTSMSYLFMNDAQVRESIICQISQMLQFLIAYHIPELTSTPEARMFVSVPRFPSANHLGYDWDISSPKELANFVYLRCNESADEVKEWLHGEHVGVGRAAVLMLAALWNQQYREKESTTNGYFIPSWEDLMYVLASTYFQELASEYCFINLNRNTVNIEPVSPQHFAFDPYYDPSDLPAVISSAEFRSESSLSILPGASVLDPWASTPTLSRVALLTAAIAGAIIAGVTVAAVVGIKKAKKTKATCRLALREKELDDLKTELKADPTNKDIRKKITKCNKKLTRAWKRAGCLGMYNGFSTNSSSGGGALSTIFDSAKSALAADDNFENNGYVDINVDPSTLVYQRITGSEYEQ